MEDIQQNWALDYLQTLIPPSTLSTLRAALLASPLPALYAALTTSLSRTVPPILDALAGLLASSPTLVSAVLTLLLAIVILQILSFAKRVLLFWTRLALRLALYAAAGLVASALWQRGLERSVADAVAVADVVSRWGAALAGVWMEEYRKAQEMQGQQGRAAQGYAGGGYRAQGSGR